MSKTLVAYFSAGGNTAAAAKAIADTIAADLYEIQPAVPYTDDDLNWHDKESRSSREMNDPSFRPPLADTDAKIADYDTVLLGFPIWWYIAPTIIRTFLEAYDFSGKRIILFATSGGSRFGKAAEFLRQSAPDAEITEGKIFTHRADPENLKEWTDSLGL